VASPEPDRSRLRWAVVVIALVLLAITALVVLAVVAISTLTPA
jgi:hypothetical protein